MGSNGKGTGSPQTTKTIRPDDATSLLVDADLKAYFDSIPHEKLMAEIENEISDGRILKLIRQYLKQKVLEGLEGWTPDEGTPQGAVISTLLANIYLNPLDHKMAEEGRRLIRYADDLQISIKTR